MNLPVGVAASVVICNGGSHVAAHAARPAASSSSTIARRSGSSSARSAHPRDQAPCRCTGGQRQRTAFRAHSPSASATRRLRGCSCSSCWRRDEHPGEQHALERWQQPDGAHLQLFRQRQLQADRREHRQPRRPRRLGLGGRGSGRPGTARRDRWVRRRMIRKPRAERLYPGGPPDLPERITTRVAMTNASRVHHRTDTMAAQRDGKERDGPAIVVSLITIGLIVSRAVNIL